MRATIPILLLALIAVAHHATAQRLIVLTQPRTVTGEVGALLAQSVDLYRRAVLPDPVKLPGTVATSPLHISPDGKKAWLTTAQRAISRDYPDDDHRFNDTFTLSLDTVPFSRASVGAAAPSTDPRVPVLLHEGAEIRLTSSPEGPRLSIRREDVARHVDFPPQEFSQGKLRAEDLVAASDGRVLVALSALNLAIPDDGEQTWLVLVDLDSVRVTATLSLPGAPFFDGPVLHKTQTGDFWVATQTVRSGFATLYSVREEGDSLVTTVERALGGAPRDVQIATAPDGGDVAVGWGAQLGVWDAGGQSRWSQTLEYPIGALAWTGEGLFSGWGRFVVAHNPDTGAPENPLALDSGWVVDIGVVPANVVPADDDDGDGHSVLQEERRGTSPIQADSDRDGIHDGIDPLPMTPSPRLEVPAAFYFHGAAAGRELKALVMDPGGEPDAPWGISFDKHAMPWLRIFPTAGTGKQVVYLGIDAESYPKGAHVQGALTVTMTSRRLGLPAPGSPAVIPVHVLPDPNPLREILWLWGDNTSVLRQGAGAHNLGAVAARLGAAPHYFSHREVYGPVSTALDQFQVMVLDFPAVLQGAVTRQELLDYIAEGGAALLLGENLADEGERSLQQWLGPAGFSLEPGTKTEGVFAPRAGWPFEVQPKPLRVRDSLIVHAENAVAAIPVAEGSGDLVFAAADYGQGRLAVAGNASLLADQPEFAVRLFHWLAESGTRIEDLDDDGLPDAREDPRITGIFDPTRTDRTNPDTDGDGLPDGMEDRNRDGWVDIGETDPRNADTDGDGIPDGADPSPLPPYGAPQILGVSPGQAPAEGGSLARIVGRNFPPGATFYFGDNPAPASGAVTPDLAVVRVPASAKEESRAVAVRLDGTGDQKEVVLQDGFVYTPGTVATLTLAPGQIAANGQHGTLDVSMQLSHPVSWDYVVLIVAAVNVPGLSFSGVAEAPGLRVEEVQTPASGLVATVLRRSGEAGWSGPLLATLTWQNSAKTGTLPAFEIDQAVVSTPHGADLQVKINAMPPR